MSLTGDAKDPENVGSACTSVHGEHGYLKDGSGGDAVKKLHLLSGFRLHPPYSDMHVGFDYSQKSNDIFLSPQDPSIVVEKISNKKLH
jgi:hypothetical protein